MESPLKSSCARLHSMRCLLSCTLHCHCSIPRTRMQPSPACISDTQRRSYTRRATSFNRYLRVLVVARPKHRKKSKSAHQRLQSEIAARPCSPVDELHRGEAIARPCCGPNWAGLAKPLSWGADCRPTNVILPRGCGDPAHRMQDHDARSMHHHFFGAASCPFARVCA